MMMIIYSEFPLLGKMFSCLRCRVVTVVAKSGRGPLAHWDDISVERERRVTGSIPVYCDLVLRERGSK
jgi:hypothetical protein